MRTLRDYSCNILTALLSILHRVIRLLNWYIEIVLKLRRKIEKKSISRPNTRNNPEIKIRNATHIIILIEKNYNLIPQQLSWRRKCGHTMCQTWILECWRDYGETMSVRRKCFYDGGLRWFPSCRIVFSTGYVASGTCFDSLWRYVHLSRKQRISLISTQPNSDTSSLLH